MQRRRFNALLAGAAGSAALGRLGALGAQQPGSVRADIYANVGPRLLRYRIADDGQSLVEVGDPIVVARRGSGSVPVGQAFLRCEQRCAYGANPRNHYLNAFEVDSSGALEPIGDAVRLRHRPIHITVDHRGEHVLSAFNEPSSIAVHRLNADGSIGAEVRQEATLDYGSVCPSNPRHALRSRRHPACTRQSGRFPAEEEEDRGAPQDIRLRQRSAHEQAVRRTERRP